MSPIPFWRFTVFHYRVRTHDFNSLFLETHNLCYCRFIYLYHFPHAGVHCKTISTYLSGFASLYKQVFLKNVRLKVYFETEAFTFARTDLILARFFLKEISSQSLNALDWCFTFKCVLRRTSKYYWFHNHHSYR